MHRLLARAQPSFTSILLIESGPRKVTEEILPFLYSVKGASHLDVLTCFDSPPDSFDFGRGIVYSVHDQDARQNRGVFIRKLASAPYTVVGLLCTGSPILERWKWMLALRSSARVIIINEEARYFGLEVWNLQTARLMLFKRLNPFADYSSEGLLASLGTAFVSFFVAPFTVAYLLSYTLGLHLRRWVRGGKLLTS